MQIIGADFVVCCDESFRVIKRGGICFNQQEILDVDSYLSLRKKYSQAEAIYYESCVITPALANPHIHLEFSQNEGKLRFGTFEEWLDSVIIHREELMNANLNIAIQQGIIESLQSGVGFIGAISSHGYDLESLVQSPLRVMYFNEIMGANTQALDVIFQDFLARFQNSKAKANDRFIPAIALHAPYSVHPQLLKKSLELANTHQTPLSVHFLESTAEREWLTSSRGYFKSFYERFFHNKMESFYSIKGFLESLKEIPNVYFTHVLEADSEILDIIKSQKGKIITCPRSNRLLNAKFLDFKCVLKKEIPLCLGTDGKSSNNTLSLLDELRTALFAYADIPLESLARTLLLSVTRNVFSHTNLKLGVLESGNYADFAVFKLPKMQEFLAYNLILYAKEAHHLYIGGKEVLEHLRGIQ